MNIIHFMRIKRRIKRKENTKLRKIARRDDLRNTIGNTVKVYSYLESDNLFGKSVHYIRFNASLLDKILSTKVKSTHNRYVDVIVNDEFLHPLRAVGEGFGYAKIGNYLINTLAEEPDSRMIRNTIVLLCLSGSWRLNTEAQKHSFFSFLPCLAEMT